MDYVTSDAEAFAYFGGPDISDREPLPAARVTSGTSLAFRPESSTPDLPAAVGVFIVAVYAGLLGGFYLAFGGSSDVDFNLAICLVYLVMYVGTPAVLLRMEPGRSGARPDLSDFLRDGLQTFTGRVSAGAALAQMLTVPLALTFAALALGVICHLAQ